MKKAGVLAAFAVCALLGLPEMGTDVGVLQPTALLQVYRDNNMIVVETDTGSVGRGAGVKAAVRDLESTASGTLFLETTDYLLLTPDTEKLIRDLEHYLRPGTEIAVIHQTVECEAALKYLENHAPEASLLAVKNGWKKAPNLILKGDRFELIQ